MPQTIKRQPISVTEKTSALPQQNVLMQAEFKGLSDIKNELLTDAQSFADVKNVYLDDSLILTSRAPFKFDDDDAYIVGEWTFGEYRLRLYRLLYNIVDDTATKVVYDTDVGSNTNFVFLLRCVSHKTISGENAGKPIFAQYGWQIPVGVIDYDFMPKVTCSQVDERIFIWFAGFDLICFNMTGLFDEDNVHYCYFEDATPYIYFPIARQIMNGIESELEDRNFLTDTYRRRHFYSASSGIDFGEMNGKSISVRYESAGGSERLYDLKARDGVDRVLLRPFSVSNTDYYYDIVKTAFATIFLRYNRKNFTIAVSFDGRTFKTLPKLEGKILGEPILTKDGLHVLVFTNTNIAVCKIAAQELDDFSENTIFLWSTMDYLGLDNSIDVGFRPVGHFETIDQYTYLYRQAAPSGNTGSRTHLVTRFNRGIEVVSDYAGLDEDNMVICDTDDVKIYFSYAAPTNDYPDVSSVISILLNRNIYDSSDRLVGQEMCVLNRYIYSAKIPSVEQIISLEDLVDEYGTPYAFGAACRDSDLTSYVQMTASGALYEFQIALNQWFIGGYPGNIRVTRLVSAQREYTRNAGGEYDYADSQENIYVGAGNDNYLRCISYNNFCTENYLYKNNTIISLPTNGALSKITSSSDGILKNRDNLVLCLRETSTDTPDLYSGYVHKMALDDRGAPTVLSNQEIKSGDIISCQNRGNADTDFMAIPIPTRSNRFYIEKIVPVNNDFVVEEGTISAGDLVRLRAYDETFTLPAGYPGCVNNTEIVPSEYPEAPAGWTPGAEWPSIFPTNPPIYAINGGIKFWDSESLPTGLITMYGVVNVNSMKTIKPILVTDDTMWYSVNGSLWTTDLGTNDLLLVDEYMNAKQTGVDSVSRSVGVNLVPPDFVAQSNEHYCAYNDFDNKFLLEVSSTRYDEDKLFAYNIFERLFYLPEKYGQHMQSKITALHPLSDGLMGIFTEDSIWYVTAITQEDGTIVYTKPVKSKLPVGCKSSVLGSPIITAPDGNTIIFSTQRGVAALSPQDFVATEEKILSYLTDTIQDKYQKFYAHQDSAANILCYKYWILFYKYLDKEILLFDTRNSSWWSWSTPYPVVSISTRDKLRVVMSINYPAFEDGVIHTPFRKSPLLGVSFCWTDLEYSLQKNNDAFPLSVVETVGYYDDVINDTLNGDVTTDGLFTIYERANPIIDWHVTSQRLHFNAPNNYKRINGINLNLKGDGSTLAKLSTKAYRDILHPEQSDTIDLKVNEVHAFVARMTLIHTVYFQYKLQNYLDVNTTKEEQRPLRLSSVSIKYEIKGGIR